MTAHGRRRGWGRAATLAAIACALSGAAPAASSGSVATLAFKAEADTWVNAADPTIGYPTASTLTVDASPRKEAYLRFDVTGLNGRTVIGARLRMFQTTGSDHGGRIWSVSANNWPETITWNTRPTIDGPQLGAFGPVAAGGYHEAQLHPTSLRDGKVSVAIDSPSKDDARWSTRESVNKVGGHVKVPRLILEVESGGTVTDGISEVAGPLVGSSSPTYHPSQHRLAITQGGRLLTAHGLHGSGAQLAWRDPAGNWQNQTQGNRADGILLHGTGTGDWPASIAIARDAAGNEHAWVVAARASSTKVGPVYLRRLSDLDAPAGPTMGPLVELDSPPLGAFKPDIAFATGHDGTTRGAVLWQRRTGETSYQTRIGWLGSLGTDTPTLTAQKTLDEGTGAKRSGTLEPSRGGMLALVRPGASALALFTHAPEAALGEWTRSASGMSIGSSASPSSVTLDSGELLSVAETDTTNDVVRVQRYSAAGAPHPVELTLGGYSTPTISTNGTRAWLLMVRESDGALVSRELGAAGNWAAGDRVELSASSGLGPFAYPNPIRHGDGRLRFVVEGFGAKSVTSSVLGVQRPE